MGNLRYLTEVAVRDVVLLLHRDAVPSESIARVRNRLTTLLSDLIGDQEVEGTNKRFNAQKQMDKEQFCRGIVYDDILNSLFHVAIPNKVIEGLEAKCEGLFQELAQRTAERDEAVRLAKQIEILEHKHEDAHAYALHSYFREVFLLRQRIANHTGSEMDRDVNNDAIFDYATYLEMKQGDFMGWEGRYNELQIKFQAYTEQAERDKLTLETMHRDAVRHEQNTVSQYEKRLLNLRSLMQQAHRQVVETKKKHAALIKKNKEDMQALRTSMQNSSAQLYRVIASIGEYHHTLADFIMSACKYINEHFSGNSSLEELARFQFQKSLMPVGEEPESTKQAKTYWRRHAVASTVVSLVMDMRHYQTDRVEAIRQLVDLKAELAQVKEENHALVTKKVFYDSKLLRSMAQSAAGGGDTSLRATPRNAQSSSALFGSSATKRKDQSVGNVVPSAALPLTYREELTAITSFPSNHVLSSHGTFSSIAASALLLRSKIDLSTIESLAIDRLFLHRIFACGRDPGCYMRDDDRRVIVEAAERHDKLVHLRNRRIFDRIRGKAIHKHLVDFFESHLLKSMKRSNTEAHFVRKGKDAPASAGPPGAASSVNVAMPSALQPSSSGTRFLDLTAPGDVREAIFQYQEHRDFRNAAFAEDRAATYQALVMNAKWMLERLDKTLVQRLLGHFEQLRAANVLLVDSAQLRAVTMDGVAVGQGRRRGQGSAGRLRGDNSNGISVATQTVQSIVAQSIRGGSAHGAGADRHNRLLNPSHMAGAQWDPMLDASEHHTGGSTSHNFLVQTAQKYFATTHETHDEAADFFKIESLAPPRCISIPTTGGIGSDTINNMSVMMLAKTALMTTDPLLNSELEAKAKQIDLQSPRMKFFASSTGITLPRTSIQRPSSSSSLASHSVTVPKVLQIMQHASPPPPSSSPSGGGEGVRSSLPARGIMSASTASERSSSGRPSTGKQPVPSGGGGGSQSARSALHSAATTSNRIPLPPPKRVSSASLRVGREPPPVY